ncbi:hypothetical protein TSH100_09300 [Azospirillum sp. TSH100]|uniref:hypothetical protein n=1 Tax=Azospirillum sp. TSH100 TaxID=652764 RepID=UPI000D61E9C6|nr:hypothetical protein [Azospirillum sp. TSH100]PWC87750.1 hypothetical protein TSH100_09300 [Azospirillum sp. TSH100]QCG88219.1 hypothetical protein E6C72_11125 [Azospirillum sp. TSH100]
MTVQAFNPSDLSQSAANWAVSQRIVGNFAPHAQLVPNLTLALDPGNLLNGTTLTEVNAQSIGPFAPPASGFRIDRVVVDRSTGAAAIVTGAANSLTPPAIPAGKLPVARVMLLPTTDAITNDAVVDERSFIDLTASTQNSVVVRAHRNNVGQNGITNNSWAKVLLTTADINVGNAFNGTTSRFQPSIAGYYLLHAQVMMNCGANGSIYAGLYLNDANISLCRSLTPMSTPTYAATTSVTYMNGTTDYVEMKVLNTIITDGILDGTPTATFFAASRLA